LLPVNRFKASPSELKLRNEIGAGSVQSVLAVFLPQALRQLGQWWGMAC